MRYVYAPISSLCLATEFGTRTSSAHRNKNCHLIWLQLDQIDSNFEPYNLQTCSCGKRDLKLVGDQRNDQKNLLTVDSAHSLSNKSRSHCRVGLAQLVRFLVV
jgi:hypothetical protein